MLKRALAVVLATACAALPVVGGGPDLQYCDPLKSTLCFTTQVAFPFEEDSDRARYDSKAAMVALEPDGHSVARRAGKIGSYAVDFAGNENSYLRLPDLPSVGPGFWTLTMWVYPDTAGGSGQQQTLLANDYKAQAGTHVYLYNNAGSVQLRITVTSNETNTTVTAVGGSNLTVGAWNFIVVGASQWPSQYGQANLFAQVNNGTKGTATLTYSVRGSNYETFLGARALAPSGSRTPFDGGLDAFYLFGDALNAAQLTNLYNAGSGKVFPFVD